MRQASFLVIDDVLCYAQIDESVANRVQLLNGHIKTCQVQYEERQHLFQQSPS